VDISFTVCVYRWFVFTVAISDFCFYYKIVSDAGVASVQKIIFY